MRPYSWRRNQFAVTAASFVGFTGFTLVMPFLPLYIQQLGADDVGEIALWAGLSLGATPAVTAMLSPFWGRVADRYGRKLLVQRSLISFVVIMAAMAWVTRPWHVFALRAIQGIFAGYGGLTIAMAAESAPREKVVRAIGLVQTAQRVGPALGPVIGGAVAGIVGLERAFFVASGFYAAALVLLTWLYVEPGTSQDREAVRERHSWRAWLAIPGFGRVMVTIFLVTFVDRSLGPILPLWVGAQGISATRTALVSGVLFSAMALGAVLGNTLSERWLRSYASGRIIAGSALAGGAALGGLVAGGSFVPMLAVAMLTFGAAMGAALTVSYADGGAAVPPNAHGEGFGYLNAANLVGLAASPVIAGLLSRVTLGWVFAIDMLLLVGVAAVVTRRRWPAVSGVFVCGV